ncbi:MAG: DUF177 domain-containing protein [Chloroflexi bacterium]|nr:DUF177 domain-containing protein [Chloroflexota bacterium]
MIGENVAQLLQAPVGTSRSYRLDEDEPLLAEELGLVSPIVGTLKLTRTNHGILAEARYSVDIEQECGRCLEPARDTIQSELSEEFLPCLNIVTGTPVNIEADPEAPRLTANHELDLTESLRQDIVVQTPLQPLCRPDCPGLCPQCGAELSAGACACDGDDAPLSDNPQLSRLGELLKAQLPPGS